jgi:hypothetical protein
MLAQDRRQEAEFALHFAAAAAAGTLAGWQAHARAAGHRRRALAGGALRAWQGWAAARAAKAAAVGATVAALGRGLLVRTFFSWRWHTQVRPGAVLGRPRPHMAAAVPLDFTGPRL